MLIDFRKDRTVILAIEINDCVLERVSSCKLLGLWIDDDLKWKTCQKGYNAPRVYLKTFYISATDQSWNMGPKSGMEFDRGTIQGHRANPKAWG